VRVLLLVAFAARLAAQDTAASSTSPATGSLVDRAARLYRSATTVRATFEQTLTSPAAAAPVSARGEYFQRGGSRFALRFTNPPGDAIVNDGTSLWLYLPSSAAGQVIKMPARAGEGLDVLSELLTAPKSNYVSVRLRDEQMDSHATSVYALSPKKADLPFTRATLWIGTSDALIWQLETVEQSGLVRRVRFTSVRTDVELPPDALAFTPPAGVKILDQSALFGKKP
jgi:outer membrane lipoprotein carrier protein